MIKKKKYEKSINDSSSSVNVSKVREIIMLPSLYLPKNLKMTLIGSIVNDIKKEITKMDHNTLELCYSTSNTVKNSSIISKLQKCYKT